MASRFWVGSTADWDATAGTKWATTSGGAGGAAVPTSSDAVFFDANSGTGTVTVNGTSRPNAGVNFTGFTGTFTGTVGLSMSGNLTLVAGMTYSLTGTLTIVNAASVAINSAGHTIGTISGAGGFLTLASDLNTSQTIDFTGVGSPTFNSNGYAITAPALTLADTTGTLGGVNTISGTITLSGGANMTINQLTAGAISVSSSTLVIGGGSSISGNITISGTASNVSTTGTVSCSALSPGGGTFSLGGALTCAAISVTVSSTVFTTNNHAVNATSFAVSAGTANLGSSLITLSGTGTVWASTSGPTINAGTSTIKFTDTSATAKTFAGLSLTYYNFWYAPGAGTATLTITGSNTFNDFRDDGSAAHSILFTTGTTQTVLSFSVSGTSGNLITINSTTTGAHNLVGSVRHANTCNYLSVQHSVATPANTWYAGTNSTNNQAVSTAGSGWSFTAGPPALSGMSSLAGVSTLTM